MSKLTFKNIKNSSVYITPNFPVISTRRYKFSFFRTVGFVFLYSLFLVLISAAIIFFTPLRELALYLEQDKFTEQSQHIQQLEDKIVFLEHELGKIVSTDKRIKYAMMLANADSVDSSAAIYDTLRSFSDDKPKEGGNILMVFTDFIDKYFSSSDDSSVTELFFKEPVNGFVNNKFDESKGHLGIDYAVKKGTPVYASAGGVVLVAQFSEEYGYWIMIKHDNNFISLYKHCSNIIAKEKQYVNQGEIIALSGNSGFNTSGPHLHFEIWQNNKAINPNLLLYNSKEKF